MSRKKHKINNISISKKPDYTNDCLEDYFDDNNGYTSKIEKMLKENAEKMSGLRWMSIHEARRKRKKDLFFKIPMNIFSGLVGMGSLYGIAKSFDTSEYTFFSIFLECIGVISTITTASYTAYNPQKKSEELTNMASKYGEIFNKIQNCLIQDYNKRPNAEHFIDIINTEIEHCMENGIAPLVTDHTKRRYSIELKREGKDFAKPFDIGEIHIKSPAKLIVSKESEMKEIYKPENEENV